MPAIISIKNLSKTYANGSTAAKGQYAGQGARSSYPQDRVHTGLMPDSVPRLLIVMMRFTAFACGRLLTCTQEPNS